jgi:mono/diheme cytochrome c family protein
MRWILPLVVLALGCGDPLVRRENATPGWPPLGAGGGGGGGLPIAVDGGGGGTFPIGGGSVTGGGTCGATPEFGAVEAGPVPQAISGGTMVALRSGALAVADVDRAQLWLLSADRLSAQSVALQSGDEPGRVIEGPTGKVYVALRRAGAILEVDVGTLGVRRLTTCAQPRGLAWDGARLVVACLGGELERVEPVDGQRLSVVTSIPWGDLRDVVVDGDRLLVTEWRRAKVWAVASDGATREVPTSNVDGYQPHVGWRALPRPGGGALFVRQQHRTTTLPSTTNCSAYGGFARDTKSSGGGSGSGFAAMNVVKSELVTITAAGTTSLSLSENFQSAVLPVDVAMSPSGRVAVVAAAQGKVTLLELGVRRDVALASGTDSQVTSAAFVGESLFVFMRNPASIHEVRPHGTAQLRFTFAGPVSQSTGHDLFHRGTRASVACASCHPEAGEDGFTWNFQEGSFRTPTLRGGIGGTAPFHWVGDMPTMMDLMSNVMAVRMAGPQVDLEGTQSLEDWLHALPKLPAPATDAEAVARGAVVFTSSGCAGCHSGAQGTNNAMANVGTGAAFQVPRLTELAWRGPWFHDGRMATLEDRFAASAGGDLHGFVSMLSPEQRRDLLEYLKTR